MVIDEGIQEPLRENKQQLSPGEEEDGRKKNQNIVILILFGIRGIRGNLAGFQDFVIPARVK